jgi:hypothetical protein
MGAALAGDVSIANFAFSSLSYFPEQSFFIPFPCQGVAMRRLREIKQSEGIEHVQ